jgi:Undecaprenyl-phosphate glucose phosphotransferase
MIRKFHVIQWWLNFAYFAVPSITFLGLAATRVELAGYNWNRVDLKIYGSMLLVTTIFWVMATEHYGLNQIQPLKKLFWPSLKASCTTVILLVVVVYLSHEKLIPPRIAALVAFWIFFISVTIGQLFRGSALFIPVIQKGDYRVAVIGADSYAQRVSERFRDNPLMQGEPACFVALPGQNVQASGLPVLQWESLPDILTRYRCHEVLLVMPPQQYPELQKYVQHLQDLGVPVHLVLEFGEGVLVPEKVVNVNGIPLLDVQPYPVDSLAYALFKRAFDFVFSLIVLIALSPVMLLIALAVKLTSSGPVFFRQERVGFKNQIFTMYKFRTMRISEEGESNTRWTTEDDPRRTLVGRLLRKTSLDELPQFFNVLFGDMSVVGPRPERPFFVEQFLKDVSKYNMRHTAKVGITGWAQVNGWRGDTSIAKRVECDLYYLRNWSIAFDLRIILLTVVRGLVGKNAY